MTDDDRRLLTEEILGECWHELARNPHGNPRYIGACSKCRIDLTEMFGDGNRTFTTWQDTGDLKERIVEMGEWRDFALFAAGEWDKTLTLNPTENFIVEVFTDWLMDPIRFPELVVGWVRERGKG